VLFWGDIIHVPPVQFREPSVTIQFDTDQAQAAESRAKALDMAALDRIKIAGAHLDFPGLGYVEKAGSGYRWRTAPYPYG
jgi:glyoxylase-like metal-dependent hydrolase (beta-lactamase superfamily II)